jgi:hypothetical protein
MRTGINAFWSVNGSLPVITALQSISNVRSMTTADFSTLYTSLPHDVIKTNLFKLVDLLFKNSGKSFLAVVPGYKDRKCWFTNEKQTRGITINILEIKNLISHVIDNSYVKFAGFIFHQCSGIPMGTNSSPQIADNSLSMMEFTFQNDPRNNDVRHMLRHTFRYMDDLECINCKEFMAICKRIYPAELPLNETSTSTTKNAYLDIDLEIEGGSLRTNIYNIRLMISILQWSDTISSTATRRHPSD